jgi:hypothetical protein
MLKYSEVCIIKLFTALLVAILLKARAFVTTIHFSPGIIFSDKARSLPLELSPMRGFAQLGCSLACKY